MPKGQDLTPFARWLPEGWETAPPSAPEPQGAYFFETPVTEDDDDNYADHLPPWRDDDPFFGDIEPVDVNGPKGNTLTPFPPGLPPGVSAPPPGSGDGRPRVKITPAGRAWKEPLADKTEVHVRLRHIRIRTYICMSLCICTCVYMYITAACGVFVVKSPPLSLCLSLCLSRSLCLSLSLCLHLLRTHASSCQVPGPDDDGLPPWREDDDGVDTFGDIVPVDLSAPEGITLKADEPELVKPLDCWPVGMTREQWEHAKKHGFSPPPPAPPNLPPAAHFWSLGGGISFSMETRSKREPRFWEKWPSPPMPPPGSFLEDALGLPPLTEEVVDEAERMDLLDSLWEDTSDGLATDAQASPDEVQRENAEAEARWEQFGLDLSVGAPPISPPPSASELAAERRAFGGKAAKPSSEVVKAAKIERAAKELEEKRREIELRLAEEAREEHANEASHFLDDLPDLDIDGDIIVGSPAKLRHEEAIEEARSQGAPLPPSPPPIAQLRRPGRGRRLLEERRGAPSDERAVRCEGVASFTPELCARRRVREARNGGGAPSGGAPAGSARGSAATQPAGETAWHEEWWQRLGCWFLALPRTTQGRLGPCLGALSLHLGSRLDALLGQRLASSTQRPPVPEQGCEWLSLESEPLRLPEFPAFEHGLHFSLPPLPRLLPPSWQLELSSRDSASSMQVAQAPIGAPHAVVAGIGVGAASVVMASAALLLCARRQGARGGRPALQRQRTEAHDRRARRHWWL